jgi:hypothetical protein
MKKINALIILIFLVLFLISFQGCATEPISFKIENSLPQSKLAYYSDPFDKLREDFWDKADNLGDVVEFVEFLPSLQNGFPVEHSTDLLRIGARPSNSTNSTKSPKRRKRCRGYAWW